VGAINVLLEMSGGVRATESLLANGVSIRSFDRQHWPLQPGLNVITVLISESTKYGRAAAPPQLCALFVTRELPVEVEAGAQAPGYGSGGAGKGYHGVHRSHQHITGSRPYDGPRPERWTAGGVLGSVAALCVVVALCYLGFVNYAELREWTARKVRVLQEMRVLQDPPPLVGLRARPFSALPDDGPWAKRTPAHSPPQSLSSLADAHDGGDELELASRARAPRSDTNPVWTEAVAGQPEVGPSTHATTPGTLL
jgi:hypothetical protein